MICWLSVLWLGVEHACVLFRRAPGRSGRRTGCERLAEAVRARAPAPRAPLRRSWRAGELPCRSGTWPDVRGREEVTVPRQVTQRALPEPGHKRGRRGRRRQRGRGRKG